MIKIKHSGNFRKAERFLKEMSKHDFLATLRKYGEKGVEALREATPKDTGKTAESWSYTIMQEDGVYSIYWKNSNRHDGANVAILLQYGHATGWGRYVKGIDYINPALEPIFNHMADDLWKEVQQA